MRLLCRRDMIELYLDDLLFPVWPACSNRPAGHCPRLAPAPPQGAPNGSGRLDTPRGEGVGTGCPVTAPDALGCSGEPPLKAADSSTVFRPPRSTLCPSPPAASACCLMLRRSSRARGCGRCHSRLTASTRPRERFDPLPWKMPWWSRPECLGRCISTALFVIRLYNSWSLRWWSGRAKLRCLACVH